MRQNVSVPRWLIGGFALMVLVFFCMVPLIGGLLFSRFESSGPASRFGPQTFREQREAARQSQSDRTDTPSAESSETVEDSSRDSGSRFERGKDRSGHGFKGHGHFSAKFGRSSGFGFSPIGLIFGLIGGVIRLIGFGLLILALLMWFGGRSGSRGQNKPSDDGPAYI